MTGARYQVVPAALHPDPAQANLRGTDAAYWHKRGANGEITCVSEVFTRHDDAVRAVRTDLEVTAEILGISRDSFAALYGPGLVYEDVATGETRPLYPTAVEPEQEVATS